MNHKLDWIKILPTRTGNFWCFWLTEWEIFWCFWLTEKHWDPLLCRMQQKGNSKANSLPRKIHPLRHSLSPNYFGHFMYHLDSMIVSHAVLKLYSDWLITVWIKTSLCWPSYLRLQHISLPLATVVLPPGELVWIYTACWGWADRQTDRQTDRHGTNDSSLSTKCSKWQ